MYTSNARNGEFVEVKLTIGQCKLLETLVDRELFEAEAGTSEFKEKALQAILSILFQKTRETKAEETVRFANWVSSLHMKVE